MAEAESTTIADLPTGDPIPTPSAPSPTPNPNPNTPPKPAIPPSASASLLSALAAAPRDVDAFLAHLRRCLQTPQGIDTVLLFVCYASRLSASLLTSLGETALRRSARDLVALAFRLPPRTTIIFQGGGNKGSSSAAAGLALGAAARLGKLSVLLSEFRTMMRLWGMLALYFWAKDLAAQHLAARRRRQSAAAASSSSSDEKKKGTPAEPERSALGTAVAWTQLTSCVAFQALENAAYLASRGVVPLSPAAAGRAARWSVRCWALYVGAELGRMAAELAAGSPRAATPAWRKALARNAAWAPLTVHWSVDGGFVSDWLVGLLGCIPGAIQMRDLWIETGKAEAQKPA